MKIQLPPVPVWGMFSSGKDSFATCIAMREAGLLKGVMMIDTGIAADTWRDQAVALCEKFFDKYVIIPTTFRYEAFVVRYGFPGPGAHGSVMNYLKGRAIREFKKDHKGECLASGVRMDESERRTFNVKFESEFEKVTVYAPLLDCTNEEVMAYVKQWGYEKPKTYLTLGVSGDCLCGAYALDHERDAIREFYPVAYARIKQLEHDTGEVWGSRAADRRAGRKPPKRGPVNAAVLCHDCKRVVENPFA